MANYQADRIWNETKIGVDRLKYFTTFVTEQILPRITEKDERFDFEDVIPTGSFREHSVISQKTNFQNYVEHEFDFMLSLRGLGAGVHGVSLVDCNTCDANTAAFKHVILSEDCLERWQDCCVFIDGYHYLMADKIMQCFEKVVVEVMGEMMDREEGLAPGCIDTTTNGPAVTLQFDIAKLPLEMQSPYPEDYQAVTLRNAGYNCINNWSIDLVLCLEAGDTFSPYSDWFSRNRRWPSQDLENEILKVPSHLVPKSIESIKGSWRLSTSRAELLMADDINKHQPLVRNCWLVLKAVLKAHLYQPKCLSSYILKTLIFYLMEHIPVDYWTEDNVPDLFLAVIDAMIMGLAKKSFPHYFCQAVNLLSETVSSEDLVTLLNVCIEIRSNPDVYLASTPNAKTYLTDLL